MNNTNLFEEFDERSLEALMGYKDSFLDFTNLEKQWFGSFENAVADKSFQEVSNEIAMDTPFNENSFFHSNFKESQQGDRYTRDIFSLMNKNCIEEMFYTHNPKGNGKIGYLIHAKKQGNLEIINLIFSEINIENEVAYYKHIIDVCNQRVTVFSGGNFIIKGKNSRIWKVVPSRHYSSFPFDLSYYRRKYLAKDFKVSSEELKQVYEDLLSRKDAVMLCSNYVNFDSLVQKIQSQLSDHFYNSVNTAVYVKKVDASGKTIKEDFLQTNHKKPWEIKLNITVRPNGEVVIKHVASNNYLKQYVDKWQKEAKARGLEVNIEALRKQVIKDFESKEIEKSFYQKFIQNSKALLDDNIAGYVEGMQVSQKIAKNIWAEGTINQSTWFTKDDEHKKWPQYAQIHPLVGGVTDGAIDEIVGIPLAVKSVYEIVTDEKKQESLKKIFTKEGASQMLEGLANEARETLKEKDKTQHFGGKTIVSVATMLSGAGFLTKAGKMDDALDVVNDISKPFTNPKTIKAIDELKTEIKYLPKNNSEIPGFIENRKNTENFLKKTESEILDDLGEDLPIIIGKGEDFTVLQKARNLPGISNGKGKEIKGKWLKGKEGNAGLFPKSVADKLNGKNFANFDEFRKEFWKTVAEDPDLSKQFRPQNIAKMKNGNAPSPIEEQWLGGQKTYVLHHKTPINREGGVYDMDNLMIVTPRFHKEILAPSYHYGYGY